MRGGYGDVVDDGDEDGGGIVQDGGAMQIVGGVDDKRQKDGIMDVPMPKGEVELCAWSSGL